MINLVRMDIYRMFKTKLGGMLLLVSGLVTFSGVGIIGFVKDMNSAVPINMQYLPFINEYLKTGMFSLEGMICDFKIVPITAIFTVMFISSEYSSGFIRNIANQLTHRSLLVVSKFAALVISVLIQTLFTLLICVFSCYAITKTWPTVDFAALLKQLFINVILLSAFAALSEMITVTIRHTAASMALCIIISINFFDLALQNINSLFSKADGSFNVLHYTIIGNMFMINYTSDFAEVMRGVAVSLIYMAVSLAVSAVFTEKEDI